MVFRRNGIALLAWPLALGLSACGVGEVDGPSGDQPERIPSDDPAVDDRLDALGIVCESTLLVSGTYLATDPQPPELNGCWPIGIWRFTAAIDRQGCDPQPEIVEEFVYEITRVDDSDNIVYVADPDNERLNLKITTNGDGLCHSSLEHFNDDLTVFTFRPTLQADGTLSGDGAYSVWLEDPF